MLTSRGVNQNGRRKNGSDCRSVETECGIENGVADEWHGDDHYLSSHSHAANAVVGGKDGPRRGRLNKWASVAQNDVS